MTTLTAQTGGARAESARWQSRQFSCSDWVAGEMFAIAVEGPDARRPTVVICLSSF
jgi:hypothetical protein